MIKNYYEFINESYVSFKLPEDLTLEYVSFDNGGEILAKSKTVILGIISYGVMDTKDDDDDKYQELTFEQPIVTNVGVHEQYKKQGLASKLYEKLFDKLKSEGYTKVFSGITRNSTYINNIWEKYSDGYEIIEGKKIYFKNL